MDDSSARGHSIEITARQHCDGWRYRRRTGSRARDRVGANFLRRILMRCRTKGRHDGVKFKIIERAVRLIFETAIVGVRSPHYGVSCFAAVTAGEAPSRASVSCGGGRHGDYCRDMIGGFVATSATGSGHYHALMLRDLILPIANYEPAKLAIAKSDGVPHSTLAPPSSMRMKF